jgi:t-SNARE complex subunit (syntaxin)
MLYTRDRGIQFGGFPDRATHPESVVHWKRRNRRIIFFFIIIIIIIIFFF